MHPSCIATTLILWGLSATLPIAAQEDLPIVLDRPRSDRPAIGPIEIKATVFTSNPIEKVILYVDNMAIATIVRPPYELLYDVGPSNVEHTFRAVVYDVFGSTGTASVTTPRLRVDEEVSISLQQLYVSATRDGRRVLDLQAEDFTILDEGRPQELITFARGDIPFTTVVLVDSSISMRGRNLRAALQGARAFFDGMRPLDEGKLLVFSDRILLETPFTSFTEILSSGLDHIEAAGGTALHDHLFLALKQLEQRQGRRVVIVLSDGVDAYSVLSMEEDVLATARRSQALIYWLRLPYGEDSAEDDELPTLANAWRTADEFRQAYQLLQRTVEESGGRTTVVDDPTEIEPAFREILQELRDQYALGYYPSDSRFDGRWRKVRVNVGSPGIDIRSRGGYLDLRR